MDARSAWSGGRARTLIGRARSALVVSRGDRASPATSTAGGAGMTVVHYLNQFFAGFGGEEAAGTEPFRIDGPVGPGRTPWRAPDSRADVTIGCGDDYFGEHEEPRRSACCSAWIGELRPDVLVCGPAFGSGRYGYACGVFAREVGRRGMPVVAANDPRFTRRARDRGRGLRRAHGVERRQHANRACPTIAIARRIDSPLGSRSGDPRKRDTCREASGTNVHVRAHGCRACDRPGARRSSEGRPRPRSRPRDRSVPVPPPIADRGHRSRSRS